MVNLNFAYDALSTREGFNNSLKHFNLVMDVIEEFEEDQINLADIINDLLSEKEMIQEQIKPLINALLYDKYHYEYSSYNLKENISDFTKICDEIKKWSVVDIVLVYYHSELGVTVINPKNIDSWNAVQSFKRNELLTIFIGEFDKTESKNVYNDVIEKIILLMEEKKFKTPANFLNGKFKIKKKRISQSSYDNNNDLATHKAAEETVEKAKPVQEAAAPSAKRQMTPMYGITVTNELFHNGNVEAWKKIITSYEHSHEGLEVLVFYDGERINDINTLFKWGKVKRGTAIMISVVGENIRNVAKLKRYLMQGASNRFEAFLKGPPNKLLKLF